MKGTASKLAAMAAIQIYALKLAFTRPTQPVTQWTDCASDYCGSSSQNSCVTSTKCSTRSGCWSGSTDACCPETTLKPQVIKCDTKAYRLTSATGYNVLNGNPNTSPDGTSTNLSAVKLVFSSIDPSSGLPNKEYLLGSKAQEMTAYTKTITFANEVVGIKLVWNSSPDWEGLVFLETDGKMQRIGQDEQYTPKAQDFTHLNGRLIGLTGKYYSHYGYIPAANIIEFGIIIDSTICEEGVFTSPNPFKNMEVDLTTGTKYSQTHLIQLKTPWKSCNFAVPSLSPQPTWISSEFNSSTGMLTINVSSTDVSLKNTFVVIHVVLTADLKNSDSGLPLDPGYTFNVSFKCTVTSLTFTQVIPNISYAICQGSLQTSAFLVRQSPSCAYPVNPSVTFSPTTASNFIQASGSTFVINSSSSADIGFKTVTVGVTLAGQLGLSKTFDFVVNMKDPCETATLSFSPKVSNMVAYVTQNPATQTVQTVDTAGQTCGNALICGARTFTISPNTISSLSLTSNVLTLKSTDPSEETVSPITITITSKLKNYPQVAPVSQTFTIEIIADPCFFTTISAAKMPKQTLFAWQAPILTLSAPFTEFVADITLSDAVDCGPFAYTSTAVQMIPQSSDPLIALSIDQLNLTVDIKLEASKIGAAGLTTEFSLTGELGYYQLSHTEMFTVIVYTYKCIAQAQKYFYQVKNEMIIIFFTVEQAPDYEASRELTVFSVKKFDGSKVKNPSFITFLSSPIEGQVNLQVSTAENADSGLYTVGFEAVFENGKATKSCSVELEIIKAPEPVETFIGVLEEGNGFTNQNNTQNQPTVTVQDSADTGSHDKTDIQNVIEPPLVSIVDGFKVYPWQKNKVALTNRNPTRRESQIIPLKAIVQGITTTGNLTIVFNKKIIIPPIKVDTNETRLLKDVPMNSTDNSFLFDIMDVVQIKVDSGFFDSGDVEIQIANYTLKRITERELDIQVYFTTPSMITRVASEPDSLHIRFKKGLMFMDQKDFTQLNETIDIETPIVPQLSNAEIEHLEKLSSNVAASISSISIGILVLQVFLAIGLKYLWNIMNLFQFLIYMTMWQITLPTTAQIVLKELKSLALLEFIPTHIPLGWIKSLLGLAQTQIQTDFCSKIGILTQENGIDRVGSSSLIDNMGAMLIIGLLIIGILILLVVLALIARRCSCMQKMYAATKKKLFYNTFLRYVLQSTLKLQIGACTVIFYQRMSKKPKCENISGDPTIQTDQCCQYTPSSQIWSSIAILSVLSICPFLFYCIVAKNQPNLNKPEIQHKIGTLYAGLNPKRPRVQSYCFVFLMRRSLFVWITFGWFEQPGLQVQLMIYMTLLYLIYIGHAWFYEKPASKSLEIFNESVFVLIQYNFVLLNNLVWEESIRDQIGNVLIGLTAFLLGTNILVIIFVSIKAIIRKCFLRGLRNKAIAKFKEDVRQKQLSLQKFPSINSLQIELKTKTYQILRQSKKLESESSQISQSSQSKSENNSSSQSQSGCSSSYSQSESLSSAVEISKNLSEYDVDSLCKKVEKELNDLKNVAQEGNKQDLLLSSTLKIQNVRLTGDDRPYLKMQQISLKQNDIRTGQNTISENAVNKNLDQKNKQKTLSPTHAIADSNLTAGFKTPSASAFSILKLPNLSQQKYEFDDTFPTEIPPKKQLHPSEPTREMSRQELHEQTNNLIKKLQGISEQFGKRSAETRYNSTTQD